MKGQFVWVSIQMITLLLVGFSILIVVQAEADSAVYIRSDGAIDPPTAPIMRGEEPFEFLGDLYDVRYILYANIKSSIVVECSHVIVDGQGFVVQGSNSSGSIGVSVAHGEGDFENAQHVAIVNMRIEGFEIGVDLASSYDVICQNTIVDNHVGARIRDRAFYVAFRNNSVAYNEIGMVLSRAADLYVSVLDNNFVANDNQISADGYANFTFFSSPKDGLNPPGHGNYWSDYNGSDFYSGPLQNQPGSDGLGDTSYMISSSLEDYYPQMAPVVLKKPSRISISTTSSTTTVGFSVVLNGTLYDIEGNRLAGQTIVLLYTFPGAGKWLSITSDTTDSGGHYHFQWIPTSNGYFTMRADWSGNATYLATTYPVALASIAYEQRYVFSIESNSTISDLVFDSQNRTLSFTASGQNGTKGYVRATIAKSLLSNSSSLRVQVEGIPYNYSITSSDDSWIVEFAYDHSTHRVRILLPSITSALIFLGLDWRIWLVLLVILVGACVCFIAVRHRKSARSS